MLPSVALEIHDLSCRPDIDTEKLVVVLEHDPMLAAHVLRVANSAIFRGRDAETSLRSAVLRLGLKNLGEVVFESRCTCACFAPPSIRDDGTAAQAQHGERKSVPPARRPASGRIPNTPFFAVSARHWHRRDPHRARGAPQERARPRPRCPERGRGQIHEDVSGMLVRQWKLPGEVAEVVAHHHGRAAVTTAPLLSAVVAVADALASKFGFAMDLGAGSCDGNEEDVFVAACAKLNLDLGAMSALEKEAKQVLARVDEALKHKSAGSPTGACASHPGGRAPPPFMDVDDTLDCRLPTINEGRRYSLPQAKWLAAIGAIAALELR
jgi:hypothetical protein